MAWRDTLSEASFRGVQFNVEERGFETGRRAVIHEYPRRDEPFTEDLGRRARRFSVRAFVLGDDYTIARDELIEACEREGPGEYVDRWRGAVQVVCESCRLSENIREGAFAKFDLLFAEFGANAVPAPLRGSVPVFGPILEKAIEAIEGAFNADFDTLTGNSFLQDEASLVLTGTVDLLTRVGDRIGDTGNTSAVRRELTALVGQSNRLVGEPAELGSRLVAVTRALGDLEADPRERFDRMLEVSDVTRALRPTATTTSNRVQAKANQAALASIVRRGAAIEAARAAGAIDFDSDTEADEIRDRLLVLIDSELEAASLAGDDEAFRELRQVLAVSSEAIKAKGATAARVITVRPPSTEPAEVLAYRLYADARRAQEIVDRNLIMHPSFVSGADDVNVLTSNG